MIRLAKGSSVLMGQASGVRSFNTMIDLDAYFERIGYGGPRTPTLPVLNALVRAHVETIPFENLDVLLGTPIDLSEEAIERKLVHQRRGGYCFEQNGLLLLVLEALGFQVRPLSARVRYQRPRDFTPPRTHLFLRVELDDTSWLADVGVGAMSLTCAVKLDTAEAQETPHEPRRIVREGPRLFHQVRFGDEWHDVAEFTLEEMPPIDRELANWFTSTHPRSHFKSRLLVARAAPHGQRLTLLNREFTQRDRDGASSVRVVESPAELLDVLAERFGLEFPRSTEFPCPGLDWGAPPTR
jgi:N-hydroxyarylamine O-acetyltransferase